MRTDDFGLQIMKGVMIIKMQIKLSDHFTYKKLLRFIFPSVIMMIFTSIYGVVDGIFVSNFVGKTPFAALNLIMPFLMLFGGVGFMIGTGGSALVSKTLGEGDNERANSLFSMLIYITIGLGAVLTVICFLLMRPVAVMLGAEGDMIEYCVIYGRILVCGLVAFMFLNTFQSFLVVAEKPQLGLLLTVAAGVTNIILDAVLVAWLEMGLAGAALATIISQIVGGVSALIYFIIPGKSNLKLGKAVFDGKALLKTCTNGSSELMTHISMSVVNMLYNFQLMRFSGENGVAAYGVIMYVNFIFISAFIGYSIGSAPIVGFNYGAANDAELKNIRKKSTVIIGTGAIFLTLLAELLAMPLSSIFVGYDMELYYMTTRAFMIYSLAFLFSGFNIFGSAFFTALNNGIVSAAISFLRLFVFQALSVLLLPLVFDVDGIWMSIIAAELVSLAVTSLFFIKMKKKYKY